MKYNYQLVVIGAGSGGLTAADLCAELGLKKVLLIDKDNSLGGECLHSGCVPSKALLHIAKTASAQGSLDPWVYVQNCIKQIVHRSDNDQHYIAKGIDVLHSEVTFEDPHTISLGDGKKITSKYFLVATGSKPQILKDIPGIELANTYTNETIFKLTQTPSSLVILGGGPIGCEMATAFAYLGTTVTLIQRSDRLLPREEPAASAVVLKSLQDLGVTVMLSTPDVSFVKNNDTVQITATNPDQSVTIDAPHVLMAAGRVPITPKQSEEIGIKQTPAGITINKYLQTSISNIYAVGDCTPSPKFTHLAGHQASLAVRNMLSPIKTSADKLQVIPWITFTNPQIARIGISAAEATNDHHVLELPLSDIDRAITDDNTNGYISVVIDKSARIVGATIVADNSSELLAPLSLLYFQRRPITDLGSTVIAYPTLASGLNILALRYISQKTKQKSYWKYITRNWR